VFVSGEPFGFALSVGLTLVGIVMTGCTVGAMLPILLKRIGLDPATSSTPFIASLVDVLGIVIFVHVAKIVMAAVLGGAH
jgi:magnesium transporter